jgi:hypothetical protein
MKIVQTLIKKVLPVNSEVLADLKNIESPVNYNLEIVQLQQYITIPY